MQHSREIQILKRTFEDHWRKSKYGFTASVSIYPSDSLSKCPSCLLLIFSLSAFITPFLLLLLSLSLSLSLCSSPVILRHDLFLLSSFTHICPSFHTLHTHAHHICPSFHTLHTHAHLICPSFHTLHTHTHHICLSFHTLHTHAHLICLSFHTLHTHAHLICPSFHTLNTHAHHICPRFHTLHTVPCSSHMPKLSHAPHPCSSHMPKILHATQPCSLYALPPYFYYNSTMFMLTLNH